MKKWKMGVRNDGYTLDSLHKIFSLPEIQIVMLEEITDVLDEGVGHQGEAKLIRVVVKKVS